MRALVFGLICVSIVACDKTYITVPTSPGGTNAGTPAAPKPATVQFRVLGNATAVKVRYATPTDGLAQLTTTLPYFNSFTTTVDAMFLSLDVTPTAYPALTLFPFLSAQILVNDVVFREATAQDGSLGTLTASGTWRR